MFLELTSIVDVKVLVNLDEVSTIAAHEGGLVINLNSGKSLQASESYEQVKELIKRQNLISVDSLLKKKPTHTAKSLNF